MSNADQSHHGDTGLESLRWRITFTWTKANATVRLMISELPTEEALYGADWMEELVPRESEEREILKAAYRRGAERAKAVCVEIAWAKGVL